jgi:hypothetical protein
MSGGIDMQDIKKLEDLVIKYKEKKKLNNHDKLIAEKILEMLLSESGYRTAGYRYMLELPHDTAGNAFLKVWLDSGKQDRDALVGGLAEYEDFTGEAGYNRLIELIRQFINTSDVVAIRLLAQLGDKMTNSGTKRPPNKYVGRFKDILMDNNELLKLNPATSTPPRDAEYIAVLVMFGLLLKSKEDGFEDFEWVQSFLQWLGLLQDSYRIPSKIVREIEKETANWPEEIQRRCVEMGLVTVVTTNLYRNVRKETEPAAETRALEKRAGNQPIGAGVASADNDQNKAGRDDGVKPAGTRESDEKAAVDGTNEIISAIKNGKDALFYLQKLGEYIEGLERKQKDLIFRLARTKQEFEAERERRLLAENKLAVVEKNLLEKENKVKMLEFELDGARNKIAEMNDRMLEMERKYESEKAELLEMIEAKSKQSVDQIKNRLVSKLRTDYLDFMQIDGEQMTVELGENLRIQLRNIFTILDEEGIKP